MDDLRCLSDSSIQNLLDYVTREKLRQNIFDLDPNYSVRTVTDQIIDQPSFAPLVTFDALTLSSSTTSLLVNDIKPSRPHSEPVKKSIEISNTHVSSDKYCLFSRSHSMTSTPNNFQ